MRLMFALLLAAEVFAQSGGGTRAPRTVTLLPPWADKLESAQQSVGRDPAPVLVVFVERSDETSRITAQVEQRDAAKAEFKTLRNMGYARIIVKRRELKKTELATRYGIKKLPGGAVLDSYGNLLFHTSVAKLHTTKGLLAMARKAQSDLDKLVKQIARDYDAGRRYLEAGNTGAARRAFEKAAKYEGHAVARKAGAKLEKLAAAAAGG